MEKGWRGVGDVEAPRWRKEEEEDPTLAFFTHGVGVGGSLKVWGGKEQEWGRLVSTDDEHASMKSEVCTLEVDQSRLTARGT